MPIDQIGDLVLSIALALPRIVAAFMVLPLLSRQTVPGMVRNSLFVSLAILVYPVVAAQDPAQLTGFAAWPFIIIKELLIGIALGFLFSSVFWALSVAGGIIDTQTGSNLANVIDPIQGHQTTLTGQWLSRLAAVLFMATGAFMIFIELLLTSYTIWPVLSPLPALDPAGILVFIDEFGYIMTTALLLAAPAILILSLTDLFFGLVNRYAQQLNVLQFSLAVKIWLATWVMLMVLGLVVEVVLRKLFENRNLLELLQRMIG